MARRMSVRVSLAGGVFAILLSSCANGVADRGATCDHAFAAAMAIDPASDTVGAVDDVIASCSSLEEWVAAASRYPSSTAGRDPIGYAETRCAASERMASTPLCRRLAQQPAP